MGRCTILLQDTIAIRKVGPRPRKEVQLEHLDGVVCRPACILVGTRSGDTDANRIAEAACFVVVNVWTDLFSPDELE